MSQTNSAPADFTPTREDRFSFGLWTVGWRGVDVFGGSIRPELDPAEAIRRLSDLGAYGITFHDNDVFPFDASPAEKEQHLAPFRKALEETGLVVPMVTTNLFAHPVFRDGGFTNNDRDVRRFAIRKAADQIDLAAQLGARIFVAWGGREGAESGAAKDVKAALARYKEAFDVLGAYSEEQGYGIRCNSVHPGGVDTAIFNPLWQTVGREQGKAFLGARHPIGRMGEPNDLGELVLWLASDRSAFVTGAEFTADGGLTAGLGRTLLGTR